MDSKPWPFRERFSRHKRMAFKKRFFQSKEPTKQEKRNRNQPLPRFLRRLLLNPLPLRRIRRMLPEGSSSPRLETKTLGSSSSKKRHPLHGSRMSLLYKVPSKNQNHPRILDMLRQLLANPTRHPFPGWIQRQVNHHHSNQKNLVGSSSNKTIDDHLHWNHCSLLPFLNPPPPLT